MVECSIDGCSKPVGRRGWCTQHYGRWYAHGDPLAYKRAPKARCTIEGCGKPDAGHGRCGHHRHNFEYHGDALYTAPTEEERFWAKVDKSAGPDACWLWTGSLDTHGYGKFRVGGRAGRSERASRVVLRLVGRPLAADMIACHRCDNPPCCNPGHLFEGTMSDNTRDAIAKGRLKPFRPGKTT